MPVQQHPVTSDMEHVSVVPNIVGDVLELGYGIKLIVGHCVPLLATFDAYQHVADKDVKLYLAKIYTDHYCLVRKENKDKKYQEEIEAAVVAKKNEEKKRLADLEQAEMTLKKAKEFSTAVELLTNDDLLEVIAGQAKEIYEYTVSPRHMPLSKSQLEKLGERLRRKVVCETEVRVRLIERNKLRKELNL